MNNYSKNYSCLAYVISAISLCSSSSVLAQDEAGSIFEIEEIVVTAQRRAESINDVPISIAAFDGSQIKNKHITSAQDLAVTPGVSGATGSSFVNSLSVRGISTSDFGIGSEPSIALYQDGVFQGRSGGALTRYYDVERVEVLKGPQGSLFGRNATAGVIHSITAKPSTDEFGGYVKAGFGERDIANFEGAVNLPLSDQWAMRIAGFTSEEDGWVKNLARPQDDDQMFHDASGVRVSLGYENNKLSATLSAGYEEREQSANIYTRITDADGKEPETGDIWKSSQDASADFGGERDESKAKYATLLIDYDLGFATLSSITGYKSYDFDYLEDFDASSFSLYNYIQDNEGDYWSEELRLVSQSEGNWDWAVGVSGYWEDLDSTISLAANEDQTCGHWIAGDATVSCATIFGAWASSADGSYREVGIGKGDYSGYSAFGDVTYHFSEDWELTAGLRYSYDKREFSLNVPSIESNLGLFQLLYNFTSPAGPIEDEESWTDVSPRVVLKYTPGEDTMVYGSISKGYKGGGFDSFGVNAAGGVASFDPEKIISYELGIKTKFWDGRANASVAAYFFDYENLQVVTQQNAIFVVRNAGQVDSTGLEMELDVQLNEYLSAHLGAAWSETEIDDVGLGTCSEASGGDCNGNSLVNNPEWNIYASVTAAVPVDDLGELFFTAEYNYEDTAFSNLANEQAVPSRELVNLRAGLVNEQWRVALYVENLTDEDYFNEVSGNFLFAGFNNGYAPSRPRTIGAEIGYNF